MRDSIDAVFGGKQRTFCIPRIDPTDDDEPLTVADQMRRSIAEAHLQMRAERGEESARAKLRARLHSANSPLAAVAALKKLAGDHWTSIDVVRVLEAGFVAQAGDPPDVVRQAVKANGPATYIGLAILVLSAHLSGVDDSAAVFDEAAAISA